MILKEIILKNFRGYHNEHRIQVDELTAFIGKNDAGKSTIFDALAIFFDHPLGKFDSSDICVRAEPSGEIRIGCVFSDFPDTITVDTSSNTSLENEYLLNEDGDLEIHKIYEYTDNSVKNKPKIVAIANHPTAKGVSDLLIKKNADLKKIADKLNFDDSVDRRCNSALRRAIWDNQAELELDFTEVKLTTEDGKKIWEQLSKYLPEYALFRADRPSTDEDSEVQDPLKVAIEQAIQEVQGELDTIEQKVKTRTLDVAQRTIAKLSDFDKNLASELNPHFKSEPKWAGLFKITLTGDDDIPINKRGSGVRRLILFSFFRAEAERLREANSKGNIIYAIEEPETAQHPDNQRKVIESLQTISDTEGCQVMLTTHVPALASLLPVNSIRHITTDQNHDRTIRTGSENEEVLKDVATDLGIIPDKRAQVLFCVEGRNDIQFLKRMNALICADDDNILDIFNDCRVAFVILGGSDLKSWVTEHYLKNTGLPEVHIYDRDELDKGKYHYQDEMYAINERNDDSIAFLTEKREMENYLHLDAINAAFKGHISSEFTFTISDECDVEKEIQTALDKGKIHGRKIKHWLNEDAADHMTIEYLKERGGYEEMKGWFTEVGNRVK